MSNSEKNVIPFKRRVFRDVSLSRITTETINLANFQEYYTIFGINSKKSLKKKSFVLCEEIVNRNSPG